MKSVDTFTFTRDLAMKLVIPYLSQRNVNGPSKQIVNNMNTFFGKNVPHVMQIITAQENYLCQGDNKRRCKYCMDQCNTKKKRENLGKSKEQCQCYLKSVL